MALQPGDADASLGMSLKIYEKINEVLKEGIDQATLPDVQRSWKKLAFAIATGVIEHLKSDMEITGIQSSGSISAPVTGTVSGGTTVAGTATGSVTTNQTAPFTGHVS
jgi:hypothetical protein